MQKHLNIDFRKNEMSGMSSWEDYEYTKKKESLKWLFFI